MGRVGWERDAIGDDQKLSAAVWEDLGGREVRAGWGVMAGDVGADADGGGGIADEGGFEASDEWAWIGLAEPDNDRQLGRALSAGGRVGGVWGGIRVVCGWVIGRAETLPEASQSVGYGTEGVVDGGPAVGPDIGQIGAEEKAVDHIDLVFGLGGSEGDAGCAIGDSVGLLAEEAEGDLGRLQLPDQRVVWVRRGGVEAIDGDPMAALFQSEGQSDEVLFGAAHFQFGDQ